MLVIILLVTKQFHIKLRFVWQHQQNVTYCMFGSRKHLADGVYIGFSRKDIIKKYRLESSANVQSIKKALLKKDLIDIDGQEITFNDSLFKLWLKRQKFYE